MEDPTPADNPEGFRLIRQHTTRRSPSARRSTRFTTAGNGSRNSSSTTFERVDVDKSLAAYPYQPADVARLVDGTIHDW
jgi:hypothetical protein